MKINQDYFRLTSRINEIKYFFSQQYVFGHLRDRIKWYLYPKLHIVPNFPTHIDIESSSKCQLQCPMCGQQRMKSHMRGNMDFILYKKIIDECANHHVYSIKLSWRGEPLMNHHLFEMVRYAKMKGIPNVAFLTNAEKFNDEKIRALLASGVDWISCSVDGLFEIYNKIRYPARFDKIVTIIQKISEMKKILNISKPLVRIQTIFSAIKDNPSEYKKFWEPYVDKINFIADQIRQTNEKDFPRNHDFACQSPWQRMCISFEGKVVQCHADYLEKNILGDFKKESLYDIWHGKSFNQVRKLHASKQIFELEPCRECSDVGEMEKIVIKNGTKNQTILQYINQDFDSNIRNGK